MAASGWDQRYCIVLLHQLDLIIIGTLDVFDFPITASGVFNLDCLFGAFPEFDGSKLDGTRLKNDVAADISFDG